MPPGKLILLPVSFLYGGGAVLIRELARRRGAGWGRIALLGVAYGIIEEGLLVQSLFNPDLFSAGLLGGRAFGVNWVWTEWTVGYHVVWSIIIPVLLAELLFPARRAEPWLGAAGLAMTAIVFALGALAIGAIFRFVLTPNFRAPPALLAGAALLVAGLAALALGWPDGPVPAADAAHQATEAAAPVTGGPSLWLVALVAFREAAAWFGLLALPDALKVGALALAPMLGELALLAGLLALLRSWSAPGRPWTGVHRLALAFGALLVNTLVGFFFVAAGNPADQLGVGGAAVLAALLLAMLAWRLHRQSNHVNRESRKFLSRPHADPGDASE